MTREAPNAQRARASIVEIVSGSAPHSSIEQHPMLTKALNFLGFLKATRGYRKKFGVLSGMRMALSVRQALYTAASGKLVPVTVPGLRSPILLRAASSDACVFHQIFSRDDLALGLDGAPSVIVDAGAYTGISSIYLSRRYPHARIISLELARDNFALLQTNVAPYPNITAVHCGLWWRRSPLAIADQKAERWALGARESTDSRDDTVEGYGVADILERYQLETIDLLKIDIEGAEYELFAAGADAWLDRVRVIAVELHDRLRPGCSRVVQRAIAGHNFRQRQQGEYTILTRM
jgi:FkbM family methyltransferase